MKALTVINLPAIPNAANTDIAPVDPRTVRGLANPFYIRRDKARKLVFQHITENPGRYTVVDLAGLTGVTTSRINKLIATETKFSKLAAAGKIAVPAKGRRPAWANKKTPVVAESFYKGMFAMRTFHVAGDGEACMEARRLDDRITNLLMLTSDRAPQTTLLMQDELRGELKRQAEAATARRRDLAASNAELALRLSSLNSTKRLSSV